MGEEIDEMDRVSATASERRQMAMVSTNLELASYHAKRALATQPRNQAPEP